MELRSGKKILCLVTMPDSIVVAIEVDRNANGREVLKQVCEKVGSIETDFFGLQHVSSKGEVLWLNLRNRVTSELHGAQPYRLELKVKFFIQPQYIQQDSTRNLFYVTVRHNFLDGSIHVQSTEKVIRLSSLLVQAELSPDSTDSLAANPHQGSIESCLPALFRTVENISAVASQLVPMNRRTAQGLFLREVSELSSYGVHYYCAHSEKWNKSVHVGVSSEGMSLSDDSWNLVYNLPYAALQRAIHDNFSVDIFAIQDDSSVVQHRLTLSSKWMANALYRDLTEMYSFFHCDTVGSIVAEQFCRDLKGTIVSLFNEHTHLGKKYVFDIERTLHEASDRTSRLLYAAKSRSQTKSMQPSLKHCDNLLPAIKCDSDEHSLVLQQLQFIRDAFTCSVCADAEINTTFMPCGHVTCCASCAHRLTSCPLCKQNIDAVQPIFLPFSRPTVELPKS